MYLCIDTFKYRNIINISMTLTLTQESASCKIHVTVISVEYMYIYICIPPLSIRTNMNIYLSLRIYRSIDIPL